MKTIIIMTFFGIFAYAKNSAGVNQCHAVTPMGNFDSTKFFKGTWHMTHVTNGIFSLVCQDLETTKDGQQLFIDYSYNKNGQERNVRCKSQGQGKNGQIPFSCEINSPGFLNYFKKTKKFQATFTIMKTNYDNYALFYKCVTLESGEKTDNYVVLSRSKSDGDIPGAAKSLLEINHESMKKCSDLINADDIKSEVV
uniref:Triatin-like salivary lipocalin n=1 Tax=Triatoma infestans TaxID=30076 RepID=A6YPS5_TRIIF|nr:triatin-like salivary lipocalin [Triatoma infestans]